MDTQRLFDIDDTSEFRTLALDIFRYQYKNNEVYREFCHLLGLKAAAINRIDQIPFLPIELFKSKKIICGNPSATTAFTSSGTTGSQPSIHHVADIDLYKQSFIRAFELFYGPVTNYCILGLLPSYLERQNSSLIYMVQTLIKKSGHTKSGFYLHDLDRLRDILLELQTEHTKVLLLGVSFALLDFVNAYSLNMDHLVVMETGGMKGRREEMVREALHERLKKGFGVSAIHSEYGMTELMSQAYSQGEGRFECPPWMRVIIRDPEDPLNFLQTDKTGGVNIIDLANIHSCSFIATQDLGKVHPDGGFEILGRFDHSDIRGCNLMAL